MCVRCTEELPEYVIVAVVFGFLLVVVLIVALLAYRSVLQICMSSPSSLARFTVRLTMTQTTAIELKTDSVQRILFSCRTLTGKQAVIRKSVNLNNPLC